MLEPSLQIYKKQIRDFFYLISKYCFANSYELSKYFRIINSPVHLQFGAIC